MFISTNLQQQSTQVTLWLRQNSDKQTWMADDFPKHFLKQPVFQKHIFDMKTLPRFPLVLSDHADVVWASWGI